MRLEEDIENAVKTQNGFKTVMSVLADEETCNQQVISALKASATSTETTVNTSSTIAAIQHTPSVKFPVTSLKLSSIMGKSSKKRDINFHVTMGTSSPNKHTIKSVIAALRAQSSDTYGID